MNKLTVILPIYNVEQYLKTCFESLLKQTYKDFEIWAVNDGSPDNSLDLINDYQSKYQNIIKVIDKKNGGYGSVLQYAIDNVVTEYMLVCDPDDYLEANALEVLMKMVLDNDLDIAVGAKSLVYADSDHKVYDKSYNDDNVKLENNYLYQAKKLKYNDLFFLDPSPHAKVYRVSLLKDVKFVEKVSFTDTILFYAGLLNANKVMYTDIAIANYLIEREGNTMTDIKPKVIEDLYKVYQYTINYAENTKYKYDIFYYRMFESFKYNFRELKRIDAKKEIIKEKANLLYENLKLLKKYNYKIKRFYQEYATYGRNERIKDMLLLSIVSKLVFKREVDKLIKEKYHE